jgi:hypothetical protein
LGDTISKTSNRISGIASGPNSASNRAAFCPSADKARYEISNVSVTPRWISGSAAANSSNSGVVSLCRARRRISATGRAPLTRARFRISNASGNRPTHSLISFHSARVNSLRRGKSAARINHAASGVKASTSMVSTVACLWREVIRTAARPRAGQY